jgi:hypothetical protein
VKFNILDCKPIGTPLGFKENLIEDASTNEPKAKECVYCSLIGGLMYLTFTRIDILYDTSLLSRLMHCVSQRHMCVAKCILRHVIGMMSYRLRFVPRESTTLRGYLDSD